MAPRFQNMLLAQAGVPKGGATFRQMLEAQARPRTNSAPDGPMTKVRINNTLKPKSARSTRARA